MTNNVTLSLLMRDSYNSEHERGDREIKKLGFTKLDKGRDMPSGYQGQTYVNTGTKTIVLASAGTNGDGDAAADLSLGIREWYHEQFHDGLEYANEINQLVKNDPQYKDYEVVTVGHSLGGAHAQMFSHTYGWEGYSWDAPKASLMLYKFGYINQLVQYNLTPKGVPNGFVNYTEKGSVISALPPGNFHFIGYEHEVNQAAGESLLVETLLSDSGTLAEGLINHFLFQHSKEHSTDYFLTQQDINVVDGWHYVGGTYSGWYNSKPNPEIGQFDWSGRASDQKAAELNEIRDMLIDHNDGIAHFKAHQANNYQSLATNIPSYSPWKNSSIFNYQNSGFVTVNQPTTPFQDIGDLFDAEERMLQDYNEGWVTYEEYTAFQDYVLDYSVGEPYYGSIWTPIPDDFGFSPIGAFYDSQSTDYDNAPSIAHHTGVLLNAQNISITDQQLQVLDTDGDGQLSTTESAGLSYWQDINEDGHLDEGELVEVSQSVPQRDYGFYTQGNGQVGPEFQNEPVSTSITVSPHIHAPVTSRPGKVNLIQSVPGSNYRSLRDSDHLYILPNGFLEWMPDQIKINYNNKGYLIGTDGDDTFDGSYYANYPQYFNSNLLVNYLAGNGNDLMGGSSRSDRLWGGIGNDDLRGYAGDDKVYGEQGADQLQGQAGNDYLDGGSENDTLFGQVGNDTLHGGAGNDILMGFTATNEAKQTLGPGERDDDHLYGGDGDDQLHGGLGTDYLDGGLGNDELDGGAGNDLLHGGTGNDQLQGQSGNDRLLGESGDDKLFGQVGDDTLWGGEGNDILNGFTATNETKQTLSAGESDNDVLYGEGGNDKLWGGLGNDKLVGGTGNDLVDGSAGDDHLWGGDGQDQLQGGDGADMLDGGTDDDILIAGSGNDTLFGGGGVDELQGNEGDDRLHGENDNDKLFGQVGNDTLLGGNGDDILVGFTASNDAKQSLGDGEVDNDLLYGEDGNDNIYGGYGNDLIDGGNGNDILLGEDGDDHLWGAEGDDEIQGNTGNDRLSGGAGQDNLFGQVGDDTIWGGDGNDFLMGFTANNETKQSLNAGETDDDILYGGGGSDALLGGLGQDDLYGGTGRDELQGGVGDDKLYGEEGDDNLFGQVGDDVLYGGEGNDFLGGFTASNETKQWLGFWESDNDHLYGGGGSDVLVGGFGDDYLDGGAGSDVMAGGEGDDVYVVNSVNDTIYETSNEGYDRVVANTNYLLNANIEELRLLEGFDIHGTGNAQDNLIIGNSSANILDGVTGADTMIGGFGDDIYYVDDAGDVVEESNGQGMDTVQSSIDITLGDNVEHLVLLDYSKPEKGLVDGQDVLVFGYPKRNELDYMQGDAVEGYQGTCGLTSIANLLTLTGQPTTESDVVNVAIDNNWAVNDPDLPAYKLGGSNVFGQQAILDSYGISNDVVFGYNEAGIANLLRGGRAVILAVNAGKLWSDTNYIGSGAVNHAVTLTGAVHNADSGELLGFYLADSGRGKVGDMTRFVDIESFRNAADVPSAYAIHTLDPVRLWDEDIDGSGNNKDNSIVGNRGSNVLTGMAGADELYGEAGGDILVGGHGDDKLSGGTGDDVYRFNLGDGHDTVEDEDGTDTLMFGEGILPDNVVVTIDGADLVLVIDDQNSVRIKDSADGTVERVLFFDGTLWHVRADGSGVNTESSGYVYIAGESEEGKVLKAVNTIDDADGIGDISYQWQISDDGAFWTDVEGAQSVDLFLANEHVGNYMRVVASYIDGRGNHESVVALSTSKVMDVNDAPVVAKATEDQEVSSGNSWHYELPDDTFWDADGDSLQFSAELGGGDPLPEWMLFDSHSITFSGTPPQEFNGDIALRVLASDGRDTAAADFTLTVNPLHKIFHWGYGLDDDVISGVGKVRNKKFYEVDSLQFMEGVDAGDITWWRSEANLMATISSQAHGKETLTIQNWFSRKNHKVDEIKLHDGTMLDMNNIESILVIPGSESDDALYGVDQRDDLINGFGGDDSLYGNGGNDTLDGGSGDDSLTGGAGNDVYLWGRGSGSDTIHDYDAADRRDSTHVDTLVFGEGVSAEDIAWSRQDDNLVAALTNSDGEEESLTLKGWFVVSHNQVEEIRLNDGSLLDKSVIESSIMIRNTEYDDRLYGLTDKDDLMYGLGGNDYLDGESGDDSLDGGSGDDQLVGGAGNDIYLWGRGSGNDTIRDYDYSDYRNSNHIDTLQFGEGVDAEDIVWSRVGNDLKATVIDQEGGSEALTIKDWYLAGYHQVEQIRMHDGLMLSKETIEASIVMQSTETNDWLYGSAANDLLDGLGGDDYLYGESGNDTLDGGIGDDHLDGGAGDDIYKWGRGAGSDTIVDDNYVDRRKLSHADTLQFGEGIVAGDIIWSRLGSDLIASLQNQNGANEKLTLKDWFIGERYQVEKIELHDGTLLKKGDIEASIQIVATDSDDKLYGMNGQGDSINGLGGNDYLYGDSGNDILNGGAGDDHLEGGAGSDTYMWGRGSGNDTIVDYDFADRRDHTHSDTLRFGEGIDVEDISWSLSGRDLKASLTADSGIKETLTLKNWYFRSHHQVENIMLNDGSLLDKSDIEASAATEGSAAGDILYGSDSKADVIYGLGGDDRMYGDYGDDTLIGGSGSDHLCGDGGKDLLTGGAGADVLRGGFGEDVFQYQALSDSTLGAVDIIVDFQKNVDVIDLQALSTTYSDLSITESGDFTDIELIDSGFAIRLSGNHGDVTEDQFVF